jgi:hypothetical protein
MALLKRKATFNINEDTHQGLRLAAAEGKLEMVELVEAALSAYFGWHRMTKIEHDELAVYRTAESLGPGHRGEKPFGDLCRELGYPLNESGVVAQLLKYLDTKGLLILEANDNSTGYKKLASFPDAEACLLGASCMRLQLTIPGRLRFQQLQARVDWEARSLRMTTNTGHARQSRWNLNESEGRYAATNIVESVIELDLGLKRIDSSREPVGHFLLPLDALADDGFVARRIVGGHRVFDVQIYRGQDGSYSLGVRQDRITPLASYSTT